MMRVPLFRCVVIAGFVWLALSCATSPPPCQEAAQEPVDQPTQVDKEPSATEQVEEVSDAEDKLQAQEAEETPAEDETEAEPSMASPTNAASTVSEQTEASDEALQPAQDTQQVAELAEPVTEEPRTAPQTEETLQVTQEVYDQTFEEIEQTIEQLNDIVRRGDFDAWQDFLSEDYLRFTSDQRFLTNVSSSPILQKQDITLKSLEDYFVHVVVPSRSRGISAACNLHWGNDLQRHGF